MVSHCQIFLLATEVAFGGKNILKVDYFLDLDKIFVQADNSKAYYGAAILVISSSVVSKSKLRWCGMMFKKKIY